MDDARLRELRERAKTVVRAAGSGLPLAEHIRAVEAMLGEAGCPPYGGITTPRGLAEFARRALRQELAPREPETATPGDGPVEGGKRRRIIKGEFPGTHIK